MSLKDDKQQNIQMELDFSFALTGEAREAGRKGTEPSRATSGTENPASTNRLMEAVCERENLKAALRQVKANKGSPGVDGMTVVGIKDYLKQHWPAIREQLLNGTYEPKPVRRVEIPKPDGGVRKLGIPTASVRLIFWDTRSGKPTSFAWPTSSRSSRSSRSVRRTGSSAHPASTTKPSNCRTGISSRSERWNESFPMGRKVRKIQSISPERCFSILTGTCR